MVTTIRRRLFGSQTKALSWTLRVGGFRRPDGTSMTTCLPACLPNAGGTSSATKSARSTSARRAPSPRLSNTSDTCDYAEVQRGATAATAATSNPKLSPSISGALSSSTTIPEQAKSRRALQSGTTRSSSALRSSAGNNSTFGPRTTVGPSSASASSNPPPPSARSRNSSARRGPNSARSSVSNFANRPAWDDTPLRARPPALRGLLTTRCSEPWAKDELVYHRRFPTWSNYDGHFEADARAEHEEGRLCMAEIRQTAYMDRWNNKFGEQLSPVHLPPLRRLFDCICLLHGAAVETGSQIGGMRESGVATFNAFDGNPFT